MLGAPRASSRDLLRPITELPDEVVHERAVLWIEDYVEVEEMCLAGFPEGAFAEHKQTSEEFDEIVALIEKRAAEESE